MQVAETPDKETLGDRPPPVAPQGASSRVPAIVVSLSALAVIGAATANSLPDFYRFSLPTFSLPSFSLPDFNRLSLPNVSLPNFSLPNFSRFHLPNFARFAAPPPHERAAVPIPDPVVMATLKDLQLSQQQNAVVLASLTQSSAAQLADLKRVSRQLSSLTVLTEAMQSAVVPLTTSSIPHSNPRVRLVATSRKKNPPPLPRPVGPVSVGGAPLSPAPGPGAG
jgi:hypothetical protein